MAIRTGGNKLDDFIPAMLAKETSQAFSNADWLYEIKWDGYRAIAEVNKGAIRLYSRNGNSFLQEYPLITEALQKWKVNAVVDGEIVVLNEHGDPDFQKLQHYSENQQYPIVYYVFDLLEINGKSLMDTPLIERKQMLAEVIGVNDVIKYSDHIEGDGEAFFLAAKQKNLEGIMAKKIDSIYMPGKRTTDWLKIKHHKTDEAVIAGFTAPRGSRKYFGALVLGVYEGGRFIYTGHTGSGFDEKLLKELSAKLQPLIIEKSPFDERVKTNQPVTWVQPQLVAELKFTEWTRDKKMRHPIFLRLRHDKKAKDVSFTKSEANMPVKKASKKEEKSSNNTTPKKAKQQEAKTNSSTKITTALTTKKASEGVIANENEHTYIFGKTQVKTTNRSKIFFPDDGITKGDVLNYYDKIADLILPYLKDRPQSLYRTPNGINQKGFFHKDAGDEAPSFVKSIPLYSDSTKRDINYILCNNKATLLYMVNMGSIEINPWHSQAKKLDYPDYMIIDIDPSDNNTFEHVIEAANIVKQVLDQAGANSYCKTSGSSGLHIYVPMGKKYTYDQVKDFAYIVCLLAAEQLPATTTLERNLSKRSKDKIYMDYLQNRKAQTIASVYSLRPKKGATVSTPLLWKEVKTGLLPSQFHLKNIFTRIHKHGDLFSEVFANPVDLRKSLKLLGA